MVLGRPCYLTREKEFRYDISFHGYQSVESGVPHKQFTFPSLSREYIGCVYMTSAEGNVWSRIQVYESIVRRWIQRRSRIKLRRRKRTKENRERVMGGNRDASSAIKSIERHNDEDRLHCLIHPLLLIRISLTLNKPLYRLLRWGTILKKGRAIKGLW